MRKYLREGVVAQSALAFTSTMLPSLFFFVYHFALSRQLGVERYGTLSSLISLLIIAALPSGIAGVVITKYVAEFKAVQDSTKLRAFVFGAVKIGGFAGALVLVMLAVGAPAIASYLRTTDVTAVRITALVVGLSFVLPLMRAVLQGMQDYFKLAISTTIDAVGRAAVGILLVFAGFGLDGAIGGVAIAAGGSLVYTLAAVLLPLRGPREKVKLNVRRLAQSTAGVALGGVFTTILAYVDLPMVKHFFSAQDAGLYGAASLAGKVVLYALAFVPLLVIPKAASRVARGEPTPIVWMSALAVTAAFSLPALALLAWLPGLILKILTGGAFAAAAPLLLPYGLAMSLMAGSSALISYSIALHRFHYLMPVGIAAVGEVWGLQNFHESLAQALQILVTANAVSFGGTLFLSILSEIASHQVSIPSKTGA